MARGLLYTLLSIHPAITRAKAARARRVRPVRPSRATELRYRFALNQVVEQCRRAGEDVAAGMRAHWPLPAATDALPGRDAPPPPPPPGEPLPVPGLSTMLEHAARRFGGIEQQAEAMAKLAAQRVLGDVDEKLAENLLRSVGVDISSYLAPDSEIGAAMREAATANVELIKSIPSEYLGKVKAAVEKAWAGGQRWESLQEEIKRIGGVTERRAALIARDQVSKMNASFNEVRQISVGIQEYDWSTVPDERRRPSHAAMEGTRQRWDSPPLVDGEHVHPGEAVRCFPGDSEVQFAHDVKKAYRRWYSGELAEIVTASGKTLRATPNHPVLTDRGWVALGQLNEGDHVIEVAEEVLEATKRGDHDRVPLIADVFEAALVSGQQVLRRAGHEVDFHGDGTDGEVDIVLAARPLFVDCVTARAERSGEFRLTVAAYARRCGRAALLVFDRVFHAANGIVRSASEFLASLWRQPLHPQHIGLGAAAYCYAGIRQAGPNRVAVDAQSRRDRQFAFAGHVRGDDRGLVKGGSVPGWATDSPVGLHAQRTQLAREVVLAEADDLAGFPERLPFAQKASRVIKASRIDGWSGHVYNLETAGGWYVTNGIVAHNCRCAAIPRINFSELAPTGEQQREAA